MKDEFEGLKSTQYIYALPLPKGGGRKEVGGDGRAG